MSARSFASWPRVAGLSATSCALAAGGMVGDLPLPVWGVAVALWAAAGWGRFGLTGCLAAGIPGLALTGGGFPALVAWTVAGLAGGLAGRAAADREEVWTARDAVRDAERDRQNLERHNRRYHHLLDACLEFSGAREGVHLAQILVKATRELVDDLEHVRVFLGPVGRATCLASADVTGAPCPSELREEETYVLTESRLLTRREGGHLWVLLPLRGDRRRDDGSEAWRGVLSVRFRVDAVDDRLALDLVAALSRLAGIGLANVDLLAQAQSLALRDSLTGLYGRHEFLRRLDEHAAQARRAKTSLAVVMCDLDHLKRYNDTWGHQAGDAALKLVARSLEQALGEDAIVCRFGGEEFAALVPGVTREGIAAIAEAARQAIADTDLGEGRRVTASLGWALLAVDEDVRHCQERADQAAYAAKAKGRNRVEAAS